MNDRVKDIEERFERLKQKHLMEWTVPDQMDTLADIAYLLAELKRVTAENEVFRPALIKLRDWLKWSYEVGHGVPYEQYREQVRAAHPGIDDWFMPALADSQALQDGEKNR